MIKRSSGMTLTEILVATFIAVSLLGLIYLAFKNTTSLNSLQALETDMKQKSITVMQDMTTNIAGGYQGNSQMLIVSSTTPVPLTTVTAKRFYDTAGTTNDTFGFYSVNSKKTAGGVSAEYIRYGLEKINTAPGTFRGYSLYKEIRTGNIPANTASPDPNSLALLSHVTLIGSYKNNKNYVAVSKLHFNRKTNDLVEIYMQLVGTLNRGNNMNSKDIYRPTQTTYYRTSVRLNLTCSQ